MKKMLKPMACEHFWIENPTGLPYQIEACKLVRTLPSKYPI